MGAAMGAATAGAMAAAMATEGRSRGRVGRWRGGWLGDERGAMTIEFTTLLPFFVFLLVFFADASLIYLTHTEMYNAARDIARRMATEEIRTEQEALDYAAGHLLLGQRRYLVDPEFGGEMRVTVAIGLGDAAISGQFFAPVLGRTLTASATVRREPLL